MLSKLSEKILGEYCLKRYESMFDSNFKKTLDELDNAVSIGIFGGSFNPMHEGHMMVAERALEVLDIDLVIMIVSRANSLKPRYELSVAERAKFCIDFIFDKNKKILVSSLEEDIKANCTYDLLNLIKEFNNISFTFIMGADCAMNFHLWDNYQDILKVVKIAIFERPGYIENFEKECKILGYENVSLYKGRSIDISSTEIRNRNNKNKLTKP